MGALDSLRQFFDRREPLLAPMDDPFVQLDRAAVERQLRLRERGAERGALGQPPGGAGTLDVVEAEVVAAISDHHARAQIDAGNSIRTYDSRLHGLTLLSRLSTIDAEARRGVGDFKAEVVSRRNRLSNGRDAIETSYEELRRFRDEHGLRRPARKVPARLATYGTIATSWAAETLLNSLLLRLNDSMGLMGGLLAAGTVAGLNVGVAAFVGRQVWPRTNLRDPSSRSFAWAGVAAWLAFAVIWNLGAAHYRDAKSLGLPDPEQQALAMMGGGLDSIYSWGLLIAGLVFALAAAQAGYRMDDPYPEYGEISRRHEERCERYADEVEDSVEELKAIRDEAVGNASDVREELERQLGERQQILTARQMFARRYEEHCAQLERTANALLEEYRAANVAARPDAPPAHFREPWTLPRAAFPDPPGLASGDAEVGEAEDALAAAVEAVSGAFDAAVDSFEPLDVLKRRLADG